MAKKSKSKPRRGRPPLPPEEGRRWTLNTRTTLELRTRLEAAAKASGRSLSHEIEIRLQESVMKDDFFKNTGGYDLVRYLALGIEMVERQTGKSWNEDSATKVAVKKSLVTLFDDYGPSPAGEGWKYSASGLNRKYEGAKKTRTEKGATRKTRTTKKG